MGLDAGEAIGDGLLLSLLEGEGVVQGAGDQVRQGPQQALFFGEVARLGGFDVEHPVQLVRVNHRQRDSGD